MNMLEKKNKIIIPDQNNFFFLVSTLLNCDQIKKIKAQSRGEVRKDNTFERKKNIFNFCDDYFK